MPALRVKPLTSFIAKLVGLIGAPEIYPVFFSTRWGIHTFGVRFPIDVLILDDSCRIVKLEAGLLPRRIFFWSPRYRLVVELPSGTISSKNLRLHQLIKLNYFK